MRYVWVAVLTMAVAGSAWGQTKPGSQPGEALVSAQNAKVYLEICETLLIRNDELRRAAGTVALPDDKKQALAKVLDDFEGQVKGLQAALQKVPLPPRSQVSEVEAAMRNAGEQAKQALGAEWWAKVTERINSPRVQARMWVREAEAGIVRALVLADPEKERVAGVLKAALQRTEDLSDSEKDNQAQADKLDAFFTQARSDLSLIHI